MTGTILPQQEGKFKSMLVELFRKHEIESEIIDGLLIFPKQRMAASVRLFDQSSGPASIVQLDITLEIGLGKKILDSYIGLGESVETAITDTWNRFLQNSFYVLLSAFFTNKFDHMVKRYEWNISGNTYHAIIGELSIIGRSAEGFDMEWLSQFGEMIQKQELSPGTHWIKLYYNQSGWEIMNGEIRLDNEVWTALIPSVWSLKYPKAEDFFSARIFIVLKDNVDVSIAAATLIRFNKEGEGKIKEELITSGIPFLEAEKIQTFIPLAFGRAYLKKMHNCTFTDNATVIDGMDNKTDINLGDEPIYTEAYKLAEQIINTDSVSEEDFLCICLQSNEFNAYMEKYKQNDTDADINKPTIFISNYLPPINIPENTEENKKRKSWKFWKK